MKKAKRKKTKKEEPKQYISNQETENKQDELMDEKSPYGGMNMDNFKKNLGCGS